MNRGVVLTEVGRFDVEDIAVDPPGPQELAVRIEASGVCHSDLHAVEDPSAERLPLLLGHEGAGVIEEVGEEVNEARVGERVVIGWRAACGECGPCRRGEPRRCERPLRSRRRIHRVDGELVSQMLFCGTYATQTVVNAAQAVPVPRELPLEQACLFACCVATGVGSVLNTAAVWPGASVGVIGCGGVGISVVQGARIAGAKRILAVDLDERKRERARQFGGTETAPALDGELDFVFDVVGRPETLQAAADALGYRGTLVLVGIPRRGSRAELELRRLFDVGARILVSHGGDYLPGIDIPLLAGHALAGELDLAGMITREIHLDDVAETLVQLPSSDGIRSVVRVDDA